MRGGFRLAVLVGLSLPLAGCLGSPPQIIHLDPGNGAGSVAATAPLQVVFDHGVERASVAHRFHVAPPLPGCADLAEAFAAAPTIPCRAVWNQDSSSFRLVHPGAPLVPLQHYTVSLDAGVIDSGGVVNSLDHNWGFTVAPAPAVVSIGPGAGATGVAVDQPLAVGFSTTMDPISTAAAIRLTPPIADTRVLVNDRDHSRFLVLPGRLLTGGARYTLSVAPSATDDRGEPLAAGSSAEFTAGALGRAGHAVVLAAGRGGTEDPSAVILTGLAPAQAGDPVPAPTVLAALRCTADACGRVGRGGALTGYLGVAGSPDGARLAVVEHDETAPPGQRSLHLISLADGTDAVIADGGAHPAWSADGRLLAYETPAGLRLLHLDGGGDQALPPGDPLQASPVWSGDGSTLALPVAAPQGRPHVDLVAPGLDARYPLPAVAVGALSVSAPALSADGTQAAVRVDGPGDAAGTWLVGLRTADAGPRRLGAGLTPLAYADAGTLVGVDRPADQSAALVRVSIATGDVTRLPGGPRAADLDRVSVDARGHRLGFLLADSAGVVQAEVENADGSNPVRLTALLPDGGLDAVAVSF